MIDAAALAPLNLGHDAAAALRIVSEAADLMRTVQDEITGAAFAKSDASPVTIAEFAVQAVVAARQAEQFPNDPVVAEEDAKVLRAQGVGRHREVTEIVRRVIPNAREEDVLAWIDRVDSTREGRFWTPHTPVIWATHLLENLTKDGMPSHPEVTDAAMAERAEA